MLLHRLFTRSLLRYVSISSHTFLCTHTHQKVHAHIQVHILEQTKSNITPVFLADCIKWHFYGRSALCHAMYMKYTPLFSFMLPSPTCTQTHSHSHRRYTFLSLTHTYAHEIPHHDSMPFFPFLHFLYPVKEKNTGGDSVGLWQILLQWLPWRSECFLNLNPMSENVKCI